MSKPQNRFLPSSSKLPPVAKRSGKRYTRAQQLKDPAKRSKLPMSALTPAQQAQRRMNQQRAKADADPLYNPAQQLGGHQLSSAVQNLTDMEFAPQEQALDRAGVSATTQGTALADRAGGYYRQLAEREASNVAMQQAIGERLQAALKANAGETDANIGGMQAGEQERLAGDAAVRGEGLGGPGQAIEELARLRAGAAAGSQVAQDAAATSSANYQGLTAASSQARGMAGGEVVGQLLNRLATQQADIRAKKADVTAQRGPASTKHLLDLRQSGFENLVTARGLDIKQSELQADVANQKTQAQIEREQLAEVRRNNSTQAETTRRGQDITRRGQDVSSETTKRGQDLTRQSALDRIEAQGGPSRKNEPAQSVKFRQNIGSGRGRFRELMRRYKNDEARVKRIMVEKDKVPPEAYNAIYDLERSPTKTLHPANVKALEALGVTVPGEWRRKRTRRRSGTVVAPGPTRGQQRPG